MNVGKQREPERVLKINAVFSSTHVEGYFLFDKPVYS